MEAKTSKDICDLFVKLKSRSDYHFNFSSLKDEQAEIILDIINETSVFAVLPTGYGKSMCYVLPPLMCDEVCIPKLVHTN